MADEEQLKILQQGVAAWNNWRKKNRRTSREQTSDGGPRWGLQSGREGEGGVGKCSRHRRVTTLSFAFCCDIRLPLKDKGNKIS
jgi:hypothetical protein